MELLGAFLQLLDIFDVLGCLGGAFGSFFDTFGVVLRFALGDLVQAPPWEGFRGAKVLKTLYCWQIQRS